MVTTIQYDANSPVVLVDTSYFVFYRYNATLKWWEFQHKDDEINYAELHNNEAFIAAFKKHTTADFTKIKKKWCVPECNVLLCLDVPRDTIWRRKMYPEYKTTRELSATFNANIFPIFYEYIQTLNMQTLTVSQLEADDIVYLTSRVLKTDKVIVITNDGDYLQMRADTRVELHNMSGKGSNLAKRSVGDPRQDMLIKILRGDISDNIPQVCPKMGEKTAAKLAQMSDESIMAWVVGKGQTCMTNFHRNRLLISFEHIPENLRTIFTETYTFTTI